LVSLRQVLTLHTMATTIRVAVATATAITVMAVATAITVMAVAILVTIRETIPTVLRL